MTEDEGVTRRLLLSVDAKGYGSATDWEHRAIQNGILEVLDQAARRSGLRRSAWSRQPGGDSELAVLPPGEPEPRVVEAFPKEMAAALRAHNRNLRDEHRLRLRLAVHFGAASPYVNGYRGAGPVVVSRLCDSEPVKAALAASDADLVVVFSRQIFADTIRQGYTGLDPAELREVRVRKKEFDEDAWLWIPGRDVRGLDLPGYGPVSSEVPCGGSSGVTSGATSGTAWSPADLPPQATDVDAVICFAEQDVRPAEQLALRLAQEGVQVFLEPWVEVGRNVLWEKDQAISASANGILVFSRTSMAQPAIQNDYAALFTQLNKWGDRRFIPVLIEDVDLPPFAGTRQPLDLRGAHGAAYDRKIAELVRVLKRHASTGALPG